MLKIKYFAILAIFFISIACARPGEIRPKNPQIEKTDKEYFFDFLLD